MLRKGACFAQSNKWPLKEEERREKLEGAMHIVLYLAH
jgi:hypothetical protein